MRRALGIFFIWLLVLLFALNTGRELAFNLLYFLTGLIVVTLWWAWINVRGLTLKRGTRGQRSQVGKYFEESLELSNGSRWPKLWVEVQDFSDLPGHHVGRVINSLGRGGRSRWQARTLCQRRGRFTLGPIVLASGDPLGIFRFRREIALTAPLVITPAVIAISEFAPPTGYLPGGETMRRRTPYVTASVAGVRDYAPGDSFNRIHWPSTARIGQLISKEFELDPLADVWLFLDMHEFAHTESPWLPKTAEPLSWMARRGEPRLEIPPSTVEYAVTITASLVEYFVRRDREVGFLSYAQQREVVQPDRGERQLSRLLEILAVIHAHGNVPLAQVLATESARLARHSTLIVITPSIDTHWVTALRSLRALGVQGVGVLLAAQTFGQAPDWTPTLADLQSSGLPAYLVKNGDDLTTALSHPVSGARRGPAGR